MRQSRETEGTKEYEREREGKGDEEWANERETERVRKQDGEME